jgi:phosphoribosyl 1,2-cyclic phosphodiesterase/CheY-like chemotaxis protein
MKTVLVIDDDADFRSVFKGFLKRHGWHVLDAADGERGLELARKHLPGAVLCDLLMPGTNGFKVIASIRGEHALRHCLVVAMSGRGFTDTLQSAYEAGADEFLLKPIDPEELLQLIERMSAPATPVERGTPASVPSPPPHGAFVRFWGVRGSIPAPGPDTVRHGGNTSCVEVRADGEIIILDSGTGIRPLGLALEAEFQSKPLSLTLLITHSHWDHVQGFPFFRPAYDSNNNIRILGFEGAREGLAGIFSGQMESPYFPIPLGRLPGHLIFEELQSMQFSIGKVQVQAAFMNHPGVTAGYRLNTSAGAVAYLPDNEPFMRMRTHRPGQSPRAEEIAFARAEDEKIARFVHGVDILILDSQYDACEYEDHIGWGHGCADDAVELAMRAEAKKLFLFHHDPAHDDGKIDEMLAQARKLAGHKLVVEAAREGLKVELGAMAKSVE